MIDFIVLEQMTAFAVIMQKHPGWVGKSQAYGLYHCSVFNRLVTDLVIGLPFVHYFVKAMIDFCCFIYEGLLQSTILESVGCIWFNRSEAKDREIVAKKYA